MENKTGYDKAIELLQKASTPHGFVAAVQEHTNYRRVWTRDGVINGLAAIKSGDPTLIRTFYETLRTIFDHQHATGFIPSNVSRDENTQSYGGPVGRADNVCWAVIGVCSYTNYVSSDAAGTLPEEQRSEKKLSELFRKKIEKCFALMDAWEFNGKHLMYVPQSGDWADEYFHHGYVLFDQLLRVWALELAGNLYDEADWKHKAVLIRKTIEQNFWRHSGSDNVYSSNLKRQMQQAPADHWFLGFNPARIYPQFDLQANALALALNIGEDLQQQTIISLIRNLIDEFKNLLPSFYPVVKPGDFEMEELRNNYAYEFRNLPHQFHNGGRWAVWNGLLAAVLAERGEQETARQLTAYIHQANELSSAPTTGWEFNECINGSTMQPNGTRYCAWSAGGAIIAEQGLKGNFLFGNKLKQ